MQDTTVVRMPLFRRTSDVLVLVLRQDSTAVRKPLFRRTSNVLVLILILFLHHQLRCYLQKELLQLARSMLVTLPGPMGHHSCHRHMQVFQH